MRIASFVHRGLPTYGIVTDDGLVDLGRRLEAKYPTLRALLAADALAEAADLAGARADVGIDDVEFLPVVPDPGQIWCCGLNYGEHVRETGREVTEQPTFFLRVAASQVGHRVPIPCPAESTMLDYEGEIAVVIGRPGRRIAEADAWAHVAGYACYNDATLRDWQKHTSQWGPGKNFWRTGAFGPWMTTADALGPDPRLRLVTRLNGTVMQDATTALMLTGIARQVAYLSTIVPLAAGDVIVTGTPGGVGARRSPPVWMKPGDVVEVEVDGVGLLTNPIVAEASAGAAA